jgi:hypothetical protein
LTVCQWFGLKTTGTVFSALTSKPVVIFLIKRQNQGGGGFLSLGLKTDNYDLVILASKSL